ncbi:MAG: hypothetical protein JST00_07845 [Deltaproteobacteria bacterium]|nr:hypothetical protein [Deltaproteobacteria bacterium]
MSHPRDLFVALAALSVFACGGAGDPVAPVPEAQPKPKIVVTTLVRDFDPSATRHDATWVAYEQAPGQWAPVTPVRPGTYEIDATGAPWAVAIACADVDDALTSVTVHRRSASTTTLSFVLDRQCTGLSDAHTLTGTLRNLPPLSGWFDFGYVDEARGVAIPTDASTPYELVNVFDGTWDLAFGVRTSPGSPLTRVALLRRELVAADHTLDVDLAGPSSFVPSTKPIVVRGMTATENLQPIVRYTAGGAAGLDVGPPDVPPTVPDVKGEYATFPASLRQENDRYRATILARDGEEVFERIVRFSIKEPIDVDVTLPPPMTVPVVSLAPAPGAPSSLVRSRVAATGGPDAHYAIRARVRLRGRQDHRWVTTFDAATAGAAIDDTMVDLSRVPGYRARWSLPLGETIEVTASLTEAERPFGDGTTHRVTSAKAFVAP